MRFSEATRAARSGKGRFLLVGAEPFLKDRFMRFVRSICPDSSTFRPDQADEALSHLSGNGLFEGSGRAIILADFEGFSKPGRFVAPIAECKDLLVISVAEKTDLKSRALSSVAASCQPVQCDKLREYGTDYPEWIASYIRESGRTASDEICGMIYHRVGPNMFSVSSELEKLFLVREGTITEEDVIRFVHPTAKATAFEVLDDLLKKDVKSALGRFSSYSLGADDPAEFCRFLSLYMEKMYRILLLRDQGFNPDDIADIVGIPRFLVKTRYLPRALGLGKSWIFTRLEALAALDVNLRVFRGNRAVLLDRLIFSFS